MPTESLHQPLDIPKIDLWDYLFERKDREYPDSQTLHVDADTGRSLTYTDVRNGALEFGKGLRSSWDWKKGDVMAFFTPNDIEIPMATYGVLWVGGTCSPANPAYTVDELAYQLKDSGAKALVTQLTVLQTATAAAKLAGIPTDRIVLIGDAKDDTKQFKHFTSIRNLAGTSRYRKTKVEPLRDLAFLVYSSGTTGRPKGVMLSHGNIVANLAMANAHEAEEMSWQGGVEGRGDRILGFLPLFHIYGLTCLMHFSFFNGLPLIVMPKFDIEKFCSTIQDWKVTFAYIVPPVVLLLSKHPCVDKYDLSSLRMMNSGAAPLTRELVDAAYARIKVPIKQGYGLSETSPTTHSQPWSDWYKTLGSVGTMLPNLTARFMAADETTEVGPGETGELWIKGPSIFLGYHNNEVATRNAFSSDGYFKTGDVGYQDSEGNFFITDRVKELIKYKGFQVPPAELEGLLMSHPSIDDVAVTGRYDEERATEVPLAHVVLKKSTSSSSLQPTASTATAKGIVSWLDRRVANHKRLRGGVRFVDVIPKTASGKILRRMLRQEAAAEAQKNSKEEKKGLKAKL